LSDEQKRQQFDQFGYGFDGAGAGAHPGGSSGGFYTSSSSGGGGFPGGFDPNDIFSQFFGGGFGGGPGAPGGDPFRTMSGEDIQVKKKKMIMQIDWGIFFFQSLHHAFIRYH
jgi:molecular chaperone DnaJ